MQFWTAAVAIITIVMVASVINNALRQRQRKADDELAARVDELAGELRSRIETLEQIVTDDKSELKRQFEQLDR